MRGDIPWDDEPEVDENVVVVSFLSHSALVPPRVVCPKGYKLHCGWSKMELYNRQRGDTFVFINRSPPNMQRSDIITSIAVGKISKDVQRVSGIGRHIREDGN